VKQVNKKKAKFIIFIIMLVLVVAFFYPKNLRPVDHVSYRLQKRCMGIPLNKEINSYQSFVGSEWRTFEYSYYTNCLGFILGDNLYQFDTPLGN